MPIPPVTPPTPFTRFDDARAVVTAEGLALRAAAAACRQAEPAAGTDEGARKLRHLRAIMRAQEAAYAVACGCLEEARRAYQRRP